MIQLRKLGNENMNKDEFVQFWMVFYDKFFKIDTNQFRIRKIYYTINREYGRESRDYMT